MALPTLSSHWPSRLRPLQRQLARQREQEARRLQQWQTHSRYFKEQQVRGSKQAQWSSRESYQQSMSAFWRERLHEEKMKSLEDRRERLRSMLQEENTQLEAELQASARDRSATLRQQQDRTEDLRSAREERRKKLAEELLKERWKMNNPELRKVESELHKDHVVSQWEVQQQHKKQAEEEAKEETRRFENEYERSRREALERTEEQESRRREEERQRVEFLRQQMEELRLREEESRRLQQEEDALMSRRLEVEQMEEDRRRAEETRKKSEFGRSLSRQYRAQLKRRAQQVQEELEADRRILAALTEGEEEERRVESARRERAVADVAWMRKVLEEQLQVEREREAEFDLLYREEAQRVWDQREDQWERERRARERLMHEVLSVRQTQLQERMEEKRQAREECERKRAELLQQLEEEEAEKRQRREESEQRRTARMHDINAQVEQRRRKRWEEQQRLEREEAELREGHRLQEEELRLEAEQMTRRGYEEKIRGRPRSAWT
ncbi:trichoplein keratin filament-binding protein [Clarias gariepinus]